MDKGARELLTWLFYVQPVGPTMCYMVPFCTWISTELSSLHIIFVVSTTISRVDDYITDGNWEVK